ncbi:tripartite tricarboxylate transporter substrate binding protein [Curvibacter sp. RS43]|uniref:Bug family tripartite tricarboxylate transporter substrate binding protein n=1 Tax=Curvibacter microcysteis TaxID=3026419 RepID=UPI0023624C6E|nr:tripartite tricarboxylate transporter substrate binding protein [Curvibacter sp. RS43]MDD0812577.1 tripartite tricarboxylate transporter substrate binding protein [Curvibacter sp. RS43]
MWNELQIRRSEAASHSALRLRRILLGTWLAACTGLLGAVVPAQAQTPDKTLRIVVPFGTGGGSDNLARILSPKLAEVLKQTVLIDNRPGAGGTVGASYVAKAAPDGQTVLLADASVLTISPALFPKLPYAAADLQPVINLAQFPHLLVSASDFPAQSVADLLALDRAKPGSLSIASSGNGASPHLTAELLKLSTGLKLNHIPYKGSGPAINDTVGGQVDLVFTGYASVASLIKAGKRKALAVTGPRRLPELPQVPTVAESGYPGFESWISQGVFAPAGTPADTVRRLNQAIASVLRLPEVKELLRQQGLEPLDNSPQDYAAWLAKQSAQWTRVIRDAGVKPDA